MKASIISRYLAVAATALLSCASLTSCDDETADKPIAAISVDRSTVAINESVTITFTGQADNVVVYTGDTDHDYELREESNTGLVVNKGILTYSYTLPGTYKMVAVATNHADAGRSVERDTCSISIRVVDDVNTIERISAPQVLYDEVFATQVNDHDWLLALPRKIKFKTSTPSIALNQRLAFYIPSESAQIEVNGAAYSSTTKYNLATPQTIVCRSSEGNEREYALYAAYYGEFKTYALAGVAATVERSEFDYDATTLRVKLPAGTDVTALTPTFTLNTADDVPSIDGVPQTSEVGTIDFSRPVVYTFTTAVPGLSDAVVTSTATIVVEVQ